MFVFFAAIGMVLTVIAMTLVALLCVEKFVDHVWQSMKAHWSFAEWLRHRREFKQWLRSRS